MSDRAAKQAADKTFRYARIECERRFLLAELPNTIDPGNFQRFEDHYLVGTTLRIRRVTAPDGTIVEQKINQKRPHDPPRDTHRIMTSVYLSRADYDVVAALGGARLVKRRHRFEWEGVSFGVDVFEGPLQGLILAEAEVESERALEAVPALPILHCEVTADPMFRGAALASGEPARVLEHARALLSRAAVS